MCGRRLLTFLLLLSFVWCSSTQEFKPTDFTLQFNLWNDIDQTLNLLEEQTNDMQTLSEKQAKRIQELESAYQSTYLLWLNSEANSRELEQNMNKCKRSLTIWRGIAIGSAVLTISVVGIALLVVRND